MQGIFVMNVEKPAFKQNGVYYYYCNTYTHR